MCKDQCYTCTADTLSKEVQKNTELKESLLFGETWAVMFSYLKTKTCENTSEIKM